MKTTLTYRAFMASAALMLTTGCVHDMYYVSAKDRDYNVVPAFTPAKITADSWVDEDDLGAAPYTSSNLVARERYHSAVLGNLHLRQSDDPDEESTVFAIRKENRAYTAETPIATPIRFGDKEVSTNFSLGHHRDHKIMAALVFRMPF